MPKSPVTLVIIVMKFTPAEAFLIATTLEINEIQVTAYFFFSSEGCPNYFSVMYS